MPEIKKRRGILQTVSMETKGIKLFRSSPLYGDPVVADQGMNTRMM
jgi:hypothetical protein